MWPTSIKKDNNSPEEAGGDGDDDEGVDVNSPDSQGSGCQKFQLCGLKITKGELGELGGNDVRGMVQNT